MKPDFITCPFDGDGFPNRTTFNGHLADKHKRKGKDGRLRPVAAGEVRAARRRKIVRESV